jgi:hypothetical protein
MTAVDEMTAGDRSTHRRVACKEVATVITV